MSVILGNDKAYIGPFTSGFAPAPDPEKLGRGLLAVREAHRYCTSNSMYPNSHDFSDCPVLREWRRAIGVSDTVA